MTYTTLDNWQAQLTAKGLSHNETVRLLQDAQEQMGALRDALRFIANHEAEPGSALETVVKFARLTLGEATP